MARVERNPLTIPEGVEVNLEGNLVKVKGQKGAVEWQAHSRVKIVKEDGLIKFAPIGKDKKDLAIAGTARALIRNMIEGVSKGYERKLLLKGVGYKAQMKGDVLTLNVGYSNPIEYKLPEGVKASTPSLTEIVLQSLDKQAVGQVAAVIRAFRPPEPYKGKGIRYFDEQVILKEGKKK